MSIIGEIAVSIGTSIHSIIKLCYVELLDMKHCRREGPIDDHNPIIGFNVIIES